MNRIFALKRDLAVLAAGAGLILGFATVQSYAKDPCPLPANTTTTSSNENSPPGPPQQNQAVLHNGFVLCMPPSAAEAHIRHGDTPQGPCDKPGRVK